MDRPSTSKPRGVCLYYNQPRGCFAGDKCKFLHGETERLTPFDRAKTCKHYTQGYCTRGNKCWFRHVTPKAQTVRENGSAEEEENVCCICLEKPTTYGLLGGCSHTFCIQCIRQWRDPKGKSGDIVYSGVTKKCPLCRAPSRFITPSSQFFPHDAPEKESTIEKYKTSMARTPCRYFQQSKSSKPFCPFGKDCFYQHTNDDGSPHIFPEGVDHCMKIFRSNRTRRSTGATRGPVYDPFVVLEELSATINVIRASLPDPRRSAESDTVNEEPPSDHTTLNEFFDFDAFERRGDEVEVESGGEGGDVDAIETLDRLADQMLATIAAMRAGEQIHGQGEDEAGWGTDGLSSLGATTQGEAERTGNLEWAEYVDGGAEDNASSHDTTGDEGSADMSGWFGPQPIANSSVTNDIPFPIMTCACANDWVTDSLDSWGTSAEGSLRNDWSAPSGDSVSVVSNDWIFTAGPASANDAETQESFPSDISTQTPVTAASDESTLKSIDRGNGLERTGDAGLHLTCDDEETRESESDTAGANVDGQHETPTHAPDASAVERQEPPFLTDGRGRVVWSSTRELGAGQNTRGWSRSGKGRKSERAGVEAVADSGFTTDGRGKVIGTSEEVSENQGGGEDVPVLERVDDQSHLPD